MSITFSTTPSAPVINWEINYWCDKESELSLDKFNADKIVSAHECDECKAYNGPLLDEVKIVSDVQMSNSNAMHVMSLLGMSMEYCGEINAKDLATLISQLQKSNLESVFSDERSQYLRKKLKSLESLSTWAVDNTAVIHWG